MKQTDDVFEICKTDGRTFSRGTEVLGYTFQRLADGPSADVDMITLKCGSKRVEVLPSRGMGIWAASNGGVRFGWDSPIAGPIHPMFVPVSEPSGLGWLDGFDEMMVRCGLESNGAPDFETNGQLKHPLHGRIANLPASHVSVETDDAKGEIKVIGIVNENRFHFQRLQLQTEITLRIDSDEISIVDKVTNLSDRPASFQMLYHNNFGKPILENGSQIFAPIKKLVPRNEHSANGIETWNTFTGPDASYAEQVYFAKLHSDENNESLVVLANFDKTKAATIRHDIESLPCFSFWKNTVGLADGYVTGLEPATNFPNTRTFEESHDRVVKLAPGESSTLSLAIGMLVESAKVNKAIGRVEELAGESKIHELPTSDWCE